jgi:hypothetical protein
VLQLNHLRNPVGLLRIVIGDVLRFEVGNGRVLAPRGRVARPAQENVVGREFPWRQFLGQILLFWTHFRRKKLAVLSLKAATFSENIFFRRLSIFSHKIGEN